MNQRLLQEIFDLHVRENRHFSHAPEAFFQAWKRGAKIAGAQWFGDGTPDGLERAREKRDLCPRLHEISDALGALSGSQSMFLAAMVSFYDAREGAMMLLRCGFEGLSDLGVLNLDRRTVIADLMLNYTEW